MIRKCFLALALLLGVAVSCDSPKVVCPNKLQQEWAEAEIGVLLHMDMQVFTPDYNWRNYGSHPDPDTFNPYELDTDQWMETASKLGAKYAVLVAKHGSGFSLWPTEAHDYSVKNSAWRDGKGDIVADFVASCKKYGIKPGIYANTNANGYLHTDRGITAEGGPVSQVEYNAVVAKQLTELWSDYGDLFEIWFDGGVLTPKEGGADVLPLVKKLQPDAIAFQGPLGHDNLIRWVGNEHGTAPDPCWATADSVTNADGVKIIEGLHGSPDAPFWCPGESDFTLRYNSSFEGGWMWHEGQDNLMFSVEELMEKYETSVGRNTNMLLGLVIDDRGLIPDADVRRVEEFGAAIKERYGTSVAETSGKGEVLTLELPAPTVVDRAVIQEDIAFGERILVWRLEGVTPSGGTLALCEGTNIGHKRIARFDPVELTALRLVVDSAKAKPVIRRLAAFKAAGQVAPGSFRDKVAALPVADPGGLPEKDWLLDSEPFVANVGRSLDGKDIILSNGLVSRVFRVFPNLATVNIINQMTGETMVRTACPEGTVTIDGKDYSIGGLAGMKEYGYVKSDWLDELSAIPGSFQVVDFKVSDLKKRMEWNQKRWALVKEWNPKGKELTFTLIGSGEAEGVRVEIHHELYDGAPIMGKWLDVFNESGKEINLDKFTLEELAMVEYDSKVDFLPLENNMIHVESDWAQVSCGTTFWETDPRYTSQVNYSLQTPCKLVVRLPHGPDQTIGDGGSFESFRDWIMPFDNEDRERKGLFLKSFKRTLAPWTTENPIFMHLTSTKEEDVKTAIDQCAETGYELVILSFGSGLNMEDESEENIARFKGYVDYAHSKGIEIGGYSLLASRWISDDVDVINPATGKRGGMTFGSSPCLSSEWGHEYFRKIKSFFEKTGMDFLEHDGSYSGDPCASTSHAFHKGLEDSQWTQRKMLEDLYKWMRAKGIFMNVPDLGTFLIGSNKCGVGYREVNWSLPRDRQIILGRQNIYDAMWTRIPTDSWTFTPLTQYHGGGAAATLEPLDEHLDAYKAHMIQNYGSGVQSCYRGFRLYDTERTKEAVKEVIDWYKKYREILCSDIIHLRRPDGRDWDGIMHVNPSLDEKGFVMLYNPTDKDITREVTLPLYYTGLTRTATVSERDGKPRKVRLDRDHNATVTVTIPANGYNWLVIR